MSVSDALTLHPKVAAGALASALSVIVIYLLQTYAHVTLPDPVSASLTAILTFAAGYLTPSPKPAVSVVYGTASGSNVTVTQTPPPAA